MEQKDNMLTKFSDIRGYVEDNELPHIVKLGMRRKVLRRE